MVSEASKEKVKKQGVELLKAFLQNPSLVDILSYVAVAYLGYEALEDVRGAALGAISLRLASSPNLIAAGAGMIGLAAIGLSFVDIQSIVAAEEDEEGNFTCPDGYRLNHNLLYGWHCVEEGWNPQGQ